MPSEVEFFCHAIYLPSAGSIWLQPGSARVASLEESFEAAGKLGRATYPWLGAFRCLINKMAMEKNLDFVLLDCSPSSGVLNRLAVMSCDYILPPATADLGSLSSLHGMFNFVIPKWLDYRRETMVPILEDPIWMKASVRDLYRLSRNDPLVNTMLITIEIE